MLQQFGLPPRGKPQKVTASDPLAQCMELQSRWKASMEISDLEAGSLCAEKDGFCTASSELLTGTVIYLLWGPIDAENPMHVLAVTDWAARDYGIDPAWDVFVGFMTPNSNKFYLRPHCSSWLRPLTTDETRGLD